MAPDLQLEAIILPEAVNAYWSPALTKLVSGIAFAIVAIAVVLAVNYYRKRHYRAALKALSQMTDAELSKVYPVNMLLKQLVGKYLPFDQVSSLTGADWIAFLNKHSSLLKPSSHLLVLADDLRFSKDGNVNIAPTQLRAVVEQWITSANLHKQAAASSTLTPSKKIAGGQDA
ncbi:DUF4381 domain-containing protein [Corallincola platygyrae]|uniref:DUF4381 domain-containing protein n=1 Tax=Corallincola platygyrae TaxID=1193278 RepID=A0ABW4XQD5_9GAMM